VVWNFFNASVHLKTNSDYSTMVSTFNDALNSNKFIITTEISPTKGVDPTATLDDAELIYIRLKDINRLNLLEKMFEPKEYDV
jgi:hypothetical protein